MNPIPLPGDPRRLLVRPDTPPPLPEQDTIRWENRRSHRGTLFRGIKFFVEDQDRWGEDNAMCWLIESYEGECYSNPVDSNVSHIILKSNNNPSTLLIPSYVEQYQTGIHGFRDPSDWGEAQLVRSFGHVSNDSRRKRQDKLVLRPQWVSDCVRENRLFDTEPYIVNGYLEGTADVNRRYSPFRLVLPFSISDDGTSSSGSDQAAPEQIAPPVQAFPVRSRRQAIFDDIRARDTARSGDLVAPTTTTTTSIKDGAPPDMPPQPNHTTPALTPDTASRGRRSTSPLTPLPSSPTPPPSIRKRDTSSICSPTKSQFETSLGGPSSARGRANMKQSMRGLRISTAYKPLLPKDRPLFISETKSVQDSKLKGSSTKEWKKRKIQKKKTLPDLPIPVVPVASVTRTPDRGRNGTMTLPTHVPPPWARSVPVIAVDPRLQPVQPSKAVAKSASDESPADSPFHDSIPRQRPKASVSPTCGHQPELREDSLAPKIISTPQSTEKLFVAFGRPFGFAVMDSPYLKRALEVQITKIGGGHIVPVRTATFVVLPFPPGEVREPDLRSLLSSGGSGMSVEVLQQTQEDPTRSLVSRQWVIGCLEGGKRLELDDFLCAFSAGM